MRWGDGVRVYVLGGSGCSDVEQRGGGASERGGSAVPSGLISAR